VSLDLNKVAAQVGDMIEQLKAGLEGQQDRLNRALEILHEKAADPDALRKKIEDSKITWLAAGIVEGLDKHYTASKTPTDFTVLATDGSHIETDRHRAARCYLLNISHVALRYGTQPDAVLESVPQLYADDKDMVIAPSDGQGREQTIEGNLLGAKRSVEECRHLADLVSALPTGEAALAILDGTLTLWGLESYPDFVTDELLDKGLLRELERIRRVVRDRKLALASYISGTRSTDVVNALRVAICPHEAANCDKYCPPGRKPDCETIAGLNDSQLFINLLAPGERSCLFASRSKVVREHYGEHAIHFFYLRVDDEIARVEVPGWVAKEAELVGLTHSLVLDQCKRGDGYPVALSEAHEQAVVTVADRENFWQLVEESLVEEHLPAPTTGKSRSKRMRWI
jgi:hypothetical protein